MGQCRPEQSCLARRPWSQDFLTSVLILCILTIELFHSLLFSHPLLFSQLCFLTIELLHSLLFSQLCWITIELFCIGVPSSAGTPNCRFHWSWTISWQKEFIFYLLVLPPFLSFLPLLNFNLLSFLPHFSPSFSLLFHPLPHQLPTTLQCWYLYHFLPCVSSLSLCVV